MSAIRMLRRRILLAAVVATAAAGASLAAPYKHASSEGDMTLGKPAAPVTIVEYASVGCPHCAHWDAKVFPQLKAKYIDSGQVRFVLREVLSGQQQVAAVGFLTARCAPPAKYFDVVHDTYRQLDTILKTRELRGPLLEVAKRAGMSEDAWMACVESEARTAEANARWERNGATDGLEGTPYFVINGVPLKGGTELADFDKAIAAAKAGR